MRTPWVIILGTANCSSLHGLPQNTWISPADPSNYWSGIAARPYSYSDIPMKLILWFIPLL